MVNSRPTGLPLNSTLVNSGTRRARHAPAAAPLDPGVRAMSELRKNPPSAVYEVGYGRPPEGAQFKPGCSGNPKGRPRKRKTVSTLIEEALARRLRVEENGRSHRISAEEIIIRRLVNAAAKGELKAVQLLLQLRDRYRDSSAESIDPQDLEFDREILDAYVCRLASGQQASAFESASVDPQAGNTQTSTTRDHADPDGDAP